MNNQKLIELFQRILPLDKSWHFIVGVMTVFFTILTSFLIQKVFMVEFQRTHINGVAFVLVCVAAFVKEVIDNKIGGKFSEKDIIYTVIGGLVMIFTDYL